MMERGGTHTVLDPGGPPGQEAEWLARVGGGGGRLLWVRKLLKKVLPDTQGKRGFDPDSGEEGGREQVRFKAKPGEV